MTTALQIIESALGKINILSVGETVGAEDEQLCLDRLNTIIDALELEPNFMFQSAETTFTLPASTTSRTIGTGLQINTARPVRIEPSFVRVSGIDYPLMPVGELEYNSISMKSVGGFVPRVCFFDAGMPTGNVYFYPASSESCEVHLVTLTPVSEFADISTEYTLAPGYRRYLEHELAIEIAPDFRAQVSPRIERVAYTSKQMIKRANYQAPQLTIESDNKGRITIDRLPELYAR